MKVQKTQYPLRIPVDMYENLKSIANKKSMSVNDLILYYLSSCLDREY